MLNLKYLVFVTFLVSFLADQGIFGLTTTGGNSISSSTVNKRNILPPPHDHYWYYPNHKDVGTSQTKSGEPHKYGDPKYNADGYGSHEKDLYHSTPVSAPKVEPIYVVPQPTPKDQPKYVAPQPAPKYQPKYGAPQPAPKYQPKYGASQPAPKDQPKYGASQPAPKHQLEPNHPHFQYPNVDPKYSHTHYSELPVSGPYGPK